MAKKIFSFRLDPDLIDRIDAASDDRTAFVTAAIELAVGILDRPTHALTAEQAMEPNGLLADLPMKEVAADNPAPRSEKPVAPKKNSTAGALKKKASQAAVDLRSAEVARRSEADDQQVLDFLKCGVRTEREIAKSIGWAEMRVSKAVARLGAAGKVKFRGGAIEVVD